MAYKPTPATSELSVRCWASLPSAPSKAVLGKRRDAVFVGWMQHLTKKRECQNRHSTYR